ncbi:Transcriptional activator-like protein [Emericellopsis cladophorae]|uniref:Transcriptional activator-like protein n=1 Tax=Emericellopsis cladophorae TaxID=2686198 RepID=A0A9P9Y869_9HYPO|nr:Transcriptional activator-like protein [Emericellopsis cladophorae]KAI6784770.1 Transcriptional activator-like protein [Emericellopsis cladophorae]
MSSQYGAEGTPAPAGGTQTGGTSQHKRVYQACIPCRRRKVRCDLGSVDNPHDPPCVRCRRESKECYFSATRRKRKGDDGEGSDADDYTIRNGRKRVYTNENTPPVVDRRLYSEAPLTPGGNPVGRTDSNDFAVDADETQQVQNPDAQTVMRPGVYGLHDALDLLYKAATDTDRLVESEESAVRQLADMKHSPLNAPRPQREESRLPTASIYQSHRGTEQPERKRQRNSAPQVRVEKQAIDPGLGKGDLSAQPGYAEAIKAWSRFRFEAFGGGFCGSTSAPVVSDETHSSSTAPWRGMRKGSLRTLGTIESLLILTEWHPRALHFPPPDATDELMLPDFNGQVGPGGDDIKNSGVGIGGKRLESWLEPAWRSDRMCWMLLSTAMGLGYEMGVFDDIDELLKDEAITRPEYRDEIYRQRANRIKRLLLIYTSQLAGRLGWTSMAPEHFRRADPAVTRKRPMPNDENTPGTALSSSFSNAFIYVPDLELDDQIIHCWAAITNAMHLGNEKMFRSRAHTAEIIRTGQYLDLLREFTPLLQDWFREFERFRLPPYLKYILTIEYEYVRIYINSLSLQAVVERCTSNAGNQNGTGGLANSGVQLSPQTILNYSKLPLGQLGGFSSHDQEYVREVVEGCRNLLGIVVDGLLPGGYLKHAPVRTYFRIISGAMFLLKTFALGAPRSDVKMSIDLMDRATEALRNCVVDDVHLGIRFADLLETLTSRLRNRFIQAPTMQQASGKGQSPVPDNNGTASASAPNGAESDWVGNHAQTLRDELNGNRRLLSPTMEGGNISATPFDLSASAFPYPGGASLGPATPTAVLDPSTNPQLSAPGTGMDANMFDDWNNPGNEMWYLPTGPAFFQNMENSSVAMTAEGVNVGGLDLLDYLATDTNIYHGADGPSSNGPFP